MNIGPEPSRKSTYSRPASSQMRPPLPSFSTTSAGRLPKLPPGITFFAAVTISSRGSAVAADMAHSLANAEQRRGHKLSAIAGPGIGINARANHEISHSHELTLLVPHKDRMTHLSFVRPGDVAFAPGVVDQPHFARPGNAPPRDRTLD